MTEEDGYENFYQYWEDNQVEQRGEIIESFSEGYSGNFMVSIKWRTRTEEVILPNYKEAHGVARLATCPLYGGSYLATISEAAERDLTHKTSYEWID